VRLVASSSSAPPLWGLWHPTDSQAEKDYLTTAEVLANPIEAANRFFADLKPILKTADHIEQQENLIARIASPGRQPAWQTGSSDTRPKCSS